MQFDVKTVNKLLGIEESYKAPEKMLQLMLDDQQRPELFKQFLAVSTDLKFDWFHEYFEDEQAERKSKKQNFTPDSVATLLNRLTARQSNDNAYYEVAAGTGGILIKHWWNDLTHNSIFTYDPRSCWYQAEEMSDRAIPFLLFNMAIRGMNGVAIHCDSLSRRAKDVYFIRNDSNNYLALSALIMNYSSENLILQNGLIVLTTKDTFFWKYFDDWIVTYKQNEVRPVTLQKYYIANQVIKELWPKVKISDITRELYQQLINLYGKKHEKQTVEDFVHIINQPFRDLKYDGLLNKDPTYRIKIVTTKKVVKNSRKYLEIFEMKKLDEFCRKDDGTYTNFIDILLRTGFRYAECLGVTMNDIDFDKHTVSINKTWNYKTDEGFQPTKNSSSVRTIEVDDYTLRCFKRNAVGVNDDEPIFRKAGIRFNSTVNDVLKSIQERYLHFDGLPITVHGLRHTHASFLISNSVSIQSVADRLGHADTITTQETYIHLLRKQQHKDNDIIMKGLAEL